MWPKSLRLKIFPASDCSPYIFPRFSANSMIPEYQGGGGVPRASDTIPILEPRKFQPKEKSVRISGAHVADP